MADDFDPLVPRPLDRPREVPLGPDADLAVLDGGKILAAPDDPADWPRWREQLVRWRAEARDRLGFDDTLYDRPDMAWASRRYVVSQVWLWDELLYDWDTHRFTPDRLLSDARERFGGFDGVVLWHAYPVIGTRRPEPVGLLPRRRRARPAGRRPARGRGQGVRRLQPVGHRHPAVPRRRRPSWPRWSPSSRSTGSSSTPSRRVGPSCSTGSPPPRAGVAVEGESTLPLERLADHPLSWAQWFADSPTPGVVRSHWFERRHQMHHVRRWHRDHAEELQSAWLNGMGVMVWEVVFGVWVGWSDRDAQTLRRMARAQRALHDLFVDGDWTPLVHLGEPVCAAGVFGSTFTSPSERVTALVNRSTTEATVPVAVSGERTAYDLWTGRRLEPGDGVVHATVPAHGVGGVWEASADADASWLSG